MEKERALEYWINRYNSAKDYNDRHWDAEERHEHRDYIHAMAWAIKAIEQYTGVPSVKRGHWEDCSNGWMCSHCERDNTKDTPFCPNCGADMRGNTNG